MLASPARRSIRDNTAVEPTALQGTGLDSRAHASLLTLRKIKISMECMEANRQQQVMNEALQLVSQRCSRLASSCYWAGTSAVSLEVLHHRQSFDLDFHTRKALLDTRPLLAEMRTAFPKAFDLTQSPDEFGSGFQGILTLPGGEKITIEVMASYADVSDDELTGATAAPALQRVTLKRYLADKIQCVVERAEARDLVDILAVLRHDPLLQPEARRMLTEQDAAIATERLLNWTDERLAADLAAYSDVSLADAREACGLLLKWLKEDAGEPG